MLQLDENEVGHALFHVFPNSDLMPFFFRLKLLALIAGRGIMEMRSILALNVDGNSSKSINQSTNPFIHVVVVHVSLFYCRFMT